MRVLLRNVEGVRSGTHSQVLRDDGALTLDELPQDLVDLLAPVWRSTAGSGF